MLVNRYTYARSIDLLFYGQWPCEERIGVILPEHLVAAGRTIPEPD
jgi:hypothetical protein